VSTKRKPKTAAKGRSGGSGRVTPSARAGSTGGSGSTRSTRGGAKSKAKSGSTKGSARAAEPDLNVGAVDRLVDRVQGALPRGRVRSAFSGTSGLSPNAVTVVGALPAAVVVAVAVATKRPFLLVVAVAVMAATIVALMKFGNTTRVVAEVSDEMVVFTSRGGKLEPRHRGPLDVEIRPYFDGRWLKVDVASDRLFVSRRAYGAVVRRLAGVDDQLDAEPVDGDELDDDG
jgi:hypothetical protein